MADGGRCHRRVERAKAASEVRNPQHQEICRLVPICSPEAKVEDPSISSMVPRASGDFTAALSDLEAWTHPRHLVTSESVSRSAGALLSASPGWSAAQTRERLTPIGTVEHWGGEAPQPLSGSMPAHRGAVGNRSARESLRSTDGVVWRRLLINPSALAVRRFPERRVPTAGTTGRATLRLRRAAGRAVDALADDVGVASVPSPRSGGAGPTGPTVPRPLGETTEDLAAPERPARGPGCRRSPRQSARLPRHRRPEPRPGSRAGRVGIRRRPTRQPFAAHRCC